jgi:hypothetical protein
VQDLAQEPLPCGSEKLSGSEHTYRIRVGDHRVVYEAFTQSRIIEIQLNHPGVYSRILNALHHTWNSAPPAAHLFINVNWS